MSLLEQQLRVIGRMATAGLMMVGMACAVDPGGSASPEVASLPRVELTESPAFPLPAHLESAAIAAGEISFAEVFEAGEGLFHTAYNGLDGVGIARVPGGPAVHRFSPTPPGGQLLAPSSQSCGGCHNLPVAGAAGLSQTNVVNDTELDGLPPFNTRSTTSVFGDGLLQLLAQEITVELQAIRESAAEEARQTPGTAVERALTAKGVDYGVIGATADAAGEMTFDLSGLSGVDPDLVVRPIGWKGTIPNVRMLVFAAASMAMGMQAEEFVWRVPGGAENPDLDEDGVERELSVGDITAMTAYTVAQETPQELAALAAAGYVEAPSAADNERVERGRQAFGEIGCATCHQPEMRLEDTVFEEPTAKGNGHYFDRFLASKDAGYDPERPLRFDLLTAAEAPRAEAAPEGGAVVRLYGDLKRHAMGRHLAEPGGPSPALLPMLAPLMVDEAPVMIAPDVFLTAELWGVGNTGPWLHDGRAGTLREAVELHGEDEPVAVGVAGRSEAQEARDAFLALSEEGQGDLVAFLLSLRTFSPNG
jgi:hypothetical protein